MQSHMTRAWVEVDLGALRRNGASVAALTGAPMLAMVKADAYGLGMLPAVRALEPLQPWGYGVASVEEGAELRASGVERPVVVFTPMLRTELAAAIAEHLTPVMGSAEEIQAWRALGGGVWHLAVDTGMSRAGVRWKDVPRLAPVLRENLPQGIFTHFHSADVNDDSATVQEHRFEEALAHVPGTTIRHLENSCAIVRRGRSRWDLVRPGIVLYGAGAGPTLTPEPVVHLRARVVSLRTVQSGDTVSYGATWRAEGERRIATLSIGYADGYPRSLGNVGQALVHGRTVPVVGAVTMDMTMIDVTGVECTIGGTATLIGRDGGHLLTVDTVAAQGSMSPYELLTRLRSRISRVYVEQ